MTSGQQSERSGGRTGLSTRTAKANGSTPVLTASDVMSRSAKRAKGKYEAPAVRAYELQHRERALLELMSRYPNHLVRRMAVRQEASWHFGRLYLVGALDHDQYNAAVYLETVTKTYESMLARYGHVHAAQLDRSSGSSVEDLSASAQKKMARAKKNYEEVYGVLGECEGKVKEALLNTLRRDTISDLDMLRRGLTLLSVGVKYLSARRRGYD